METAQKPQFLVQLLPRIMNVAFFRLKHSNMLGHLALTHTVFRRNPDRVLTTFANSGVAGSLTLSQGGFEILLCIIMSG